MYNSWLGSQGNLNAFELDGEEKAHGEAQSFLAEKLAEIKELVKDNGIAGIVALLIEVVAFNIFILLPATFVLFHQRLGQWMPTPTTTSDFWGAFGAVYIFCKFPPIEAARFAFAFRIIPWVAKHLPEDVKALDIEEMVREYFRVDRSDPAEEKREKD